MKVVTGILALSLVALSVGSANAAPRFVIGELFTNTYCPPCATFDPALDEWGTGHLEDYVLVAYHGWWPGYGDVFWQADSVENRPRINYYGADYAPHFRMDGIADLGSAISPPSWTSTLNARKAISSPLTIDLSATYDSGTRSGILTATITNVSGATVTGNFRTAVIESIWYHTAGGNGYDGNNGSVRDLVPNPTGTPVSLAPSASTVINQPYSLPSTTPPAPGLNPDRCQLICFVQGASKEIYQGARLFFPFDSPFILLQGVVATPAPGGDGDAYIDGGETGQVVVTLKNLNGGAATGTTGTITTSDSYVTVLDGTASFGTIPGFGTGSNGADPFTFSVSPSAPSGYLPQFTLTVTSGAVAYTRVLTFGVDVGSPTDYTGPAGVYYAYENTDVGYTETPAYTWVEIDSTLGGPGHRVAHYDDSVDWVALGFPFKFYGVTYDTLTVSSNGWVAFGRQFPMQGDPSPSAIPGADGPYSMIAGMWCDLNPTASGVGKIYRYADTVNHRYIIEYSRIVHSSGSSPETFQIILLNPAFYPTSTGDGEILVQYKDVNAPDLAAAGIENAAQTVGIQYSLLGHANPAAVGIADLRSVKYTPDAPLRTDVPVGIAGAGPALLLAASPNPFAASTRIAFRLPERQAAAVEIYSVDGRHVATLFEGVAEAGITTASWNGLDASQHSVPSGLYFARLTTAGETQVGKVMVLR